MASTEVAVIGTGWCGGIRAETLAKSALVDALHIQRGIAGEANVENAKTRRGNDTPQPGHDTIV